MLQLTRQDIIQSVEISTIAHATDDLAKVEQALRMVLPDSLKGSAIFNRKYLQGHHGNPIITFDAKLKRPAQVSEFTNHFLRHLGRNERLLIQRDLRLQSNSEGNLYIRIDKQRALGGLIELGDEDPIRVRMKFTRLRGDAKALMIRLLEAE